MTAEFLQLPFRSHEPHAHRRSWYTTQKLKFGFSRQMIAESKRVRTDKAYLDMARRSWLVLAGEGWVKKPNFNF